MHISRIGHVVRVVSKSEVGWSLNIRAWKASLFLSRLSAEGSEKGVIVTNHAIHVIKSVTPFI
jgi:hypothetical protein